MKNFMSWIFGWVIIIFVGILPGLLWWLLSIQVTNGTLGVYEWLSVGAVELLGGSQWFIYLRSLRKSTGRKKLNPKIRLHKR